jgi:hypothetical protein
MNALSKTGLPRERLQRGQAMVFTLAFAGATALVALVLFNSGMMANAKTRLQNAADAGAYSAGLLQARDHNFSAYTNRAIVANQAAVAQLVSLKSYTEDAADTRDRMDGAILSVEALLPSNTSVWDTAKSIPIGSVNSTVAALAPVAVKGLDLLIHAFEAAQEAHHLATAIDMAVVADEVVKRNDANAAVTNSAYLVGRTMVQVKAWDDSTKRHRANDASSEADRFADLVVSDKSTDPFTRNRFSFPLPMWSSSVKMCQLMPNYSGSHTAFVFTHSGGTILSDDKKRWLALDATLGAGYWTCTFWYPCWTGICHTSIGSPLIDDNFGMGGSGGGLAGGGSGYNDAIGYKNNPASAKMYGDALVNPLTMLPAGIRYGVTGPGGTLDANGGLQDYYRDMANPGASTPANQTPEANGAALTVTLEVERKGGTIHTSSKLMPGSEQLYLADGLKGGTMRALAGAQSYFYRARDDDPARFTRNGWKRGDGKTEMANLFSPYWQARLADRSAADRAASWAAQ